MFSTNTVALITMFAGALLMGLVTVPGSGAEGSLYLACLGLAFLTIGCIVACIGAAERR